MRSNRMGLANLGVLAATGLVFLVLLLVGCATVGVRDDAALARVPFDGPPVTLGLCALLDEGVTATEAAALLDEAWREDGARYGVAIRLVQTAAWKRPAFRGDGIMVALRREPLEAPCDRVMAFVGRHAGDVLWALFLPQALGAVTRARGPAASWSPASPASTRSSCRLPRRSATSSITCAAATTSCASPDAASGSPS